MVLKNGGQEEYERILRSFYETGETISCMIVRLCEILEGLYTHLMLVSQRTTMSASLQCTVSEQPVTLISRDVLWTGL